MQDEHSNAPQPQEARAAWVEPVLSRISAGSAELENKTQFDGADDS